MIRAELIGAKVKGVDSCPIGIIQDHFGFKGRQRFHLSGIEIPCHYDPLEIQGLTMPVDRTIRKEESGQIVFFVLYFIDSIILPLVVVIEIDEMILQKMVYFCFDVLLK